MYSIAITIPSIKDNLEEQLKCIQETSTGNFSIYTSQTKNSASYNRNRCLEQSVDNDFVIMIDDDISGFFTGWNEVLVKPFMEDNRICLVAARLINKDGTIHATIAGNRDTSNRLCVVGTVCSACIAFRKTEIRFDENFVGSGFEDTDFVRQIVQNNNGGKIVINNDCKLIHINEMKGQTGENNTVNQRYYVEKWSRR
jgi:hypothetical protein